MTCGLSSVHQFENNISVILSPKTMLVECSWVVMKCMPKRAFQIGVLCTILIFVAKVIHILLHIVRFFSQLHLLQRFLSFLHCHSLSKCFDAISLVYDNLTSVDSPASRCQIFFFIMLRAIMSWVISKIACHYVTCRVRVVSEHRYLRLYR